MDFSTVSVNDLARSCARSADVAEWEELVRRCTPLASQVALRVSRLWSISPHPSEVDEIVQEIFLKLCDQNYRILRAFRPQSDDSFMALLQTISKSVATDYLRRARSTKRGGKVITNQLGHEAPPGMPSPANGVNNIQKHVLYEELDLKLRAGVNERDRIVFWLYYLHGFTAKDIARLPVDLSAKGVESAIRRISIWLKDEIELRGENKVPPDTETPK